MSTQIITEELIETLKGIKAGRRDIEWRDSAGRWQPITDEPMASLEKNALNWAMLGHPIRIKPFVPTPPEPSAWISPDTWIPWTGGNCPLPADTLVDVTFRSGMVMSAVAANTLLWQHAAWRSDQDRPPGDIVMFRLAADPPKPEYVPWTFETRPLEMVWVYKKGYITDRLITAWKDDSVEIGGYAIVSYEALFSNWIQRDGTPCGNLKP